MTTTPPQEPRMSITDARTLPDHSHRPEYPTGPHCPACMALGRINPDTGTPWPSLDEHGEKVLADADRRFNDRYDGLNHETAFEAAVTEAYLRGRMRGRMDERTELGASGRGHLTNAAEHLRQAADAAEAGDADRAATHASLASSHASAARTLTRAAGPQA